MDCRETAVISLALTSLVLRFFHLLFQVKLKLYEIEIVVGVVLTLDRLVSRIIC